MSGTKLTELDASGCTALEALNLSGSSLNSLVVENCTALKELSANGTELASLSVEGCSALESLNVGESVELSGLESAGMREQWLLASSYFSNNMAGMIEGFPNGFGNAGVFSEQTNYTYDDLNRLVSANSTTTPDYTEEIYGQENYSNKEYAYEGEGLRPVSAIEDASGFVSEYACEYDNAGNLVTFEYGTGDFRSTASYTYEDGRIVGASELYSTYRTMDWTASCDEDGRIVEYVQMDDRGNKNVKFRGTYDENGRIVRATCPWNVDMTVDFTYDDAGHVTKMSMGQLKDGEFDRKRSTQQVEIEYTDGRPTKATANSSYDGEATAAYEATVSYDNYGNVVRIDCITNIPFGNDTRNDYAEFTYVRVITPKDAQDVYMPVNFGSPVGLVSHNEPWETWNPMEGQDPVAARFCNAMILEKYL